MKGLAFAVIRKLGCENGFYVFGVGGEDAASSCWGSFDGVGWAAGGDEPGEPGFEVFVGDGAADGGDYWVDVCVESGAGGVCFVLGGSEGQ